MSPIVSLLSIFAILNSSFLTAVAHSDHSSQSGLSDSDWFHSDDHEAHALFRRQTTTAPVGSPDWLNAYPAYSPDLTKTPPAWTAALKKAVDSGKIPNIPQSTNADGSPQYPPGTDPASPAVCSGYPIWKCHGTADIWDAPDGSIGIGFDDGPVPSASPALYAFLKAQNQKSTQFVIGTSIRNASATFLQAYNDGHDIAVHTYSHQLSTSLSNDQILAELGWTIQLIYDLTGGRLPKFWRPPYGDIDNRIRAIATQVFGLSAIIWNHDTEDWSISSNRTTPALVASNLTLWINGAKSPGLIILEHELTNETVGAFINAYPNMKAKGWRTVSVAQLVASGVDKATGKAYWNADNGNAGTPSPISILAKGLIATAPAPTVTTTSTTSTTATTTPATSAGSNSSPTTGGSAPTSNSGAIRTSFETTFSIIGLLWTVVNFI